MTHVCRVIMIKGQTLCFSVQLGSCFYDHLACVPPPLMPLFFMFCCQAHKVNCLNDRCIVLYTVALVARQSSHSLTLYRIIQSAQLSPLKCFTKCICALPHKIDTSYYTKWLTRLSLFFISIFFPGGGWCSQSDLHAGCRIGDI